MRCINAVMIVIIAVRLIKIIVVMLVKRNKATSEYSSYKKEEIEYDYSKFSDEDCLAPHYENNK